MKTREWTHPRAVAAPEPIALGLLHTDYGIHHSFRIRERAGGEF